MKYRLRFLSGWDGKADSTDPECEKKQYKAGDELDVDVKTYQALIFQYAKAEPVSVEDIEMNALKTKTPPQKKNQRRASNTTNKKTGKIKGQDKMQRNSTQ